MPWHSNTEQDTRNNTYPPQHIYEIEDEVISYYEQAPFLYFLNTNQDDLNVY